MKTKTNEIAGAIWNAREWLWIGAGLIYMATLVTIALLGSICVQ